jgi:ketosteroid isomerase-like protein
MKAATLVTLFAAASLAAACTGGRKMVNTAKIVDTIKANEVRSNADWAAHDVGRIVSFFSPDASVILPGAPVMTGTKALTDGIGKTLDDPNFSLTYASDRVFVAASGDLAVARGTYRQSGADPASGKTVTTVGAYVTVFRPQPDGSWKGVWDIVTPGPAKAPAPAGK